jgi:hypothetical protein
VLWVDAALCLLNGLSLVDIPLPSPPPSFDMSHGDISEDHVADDRETVSPAQDDDDLKTQETEKKLKKQGSLGIHSFPSTF